MLDITKEFRERSRGQYYTDFSFLKDGSTFPNLEILDRNAVYRMRYKQLLGEDIKSLNFIFSVAGENYEIPIEPIGENFFALTTNKILDLIFNNEWMVKTGNLKTDKQLEKLIERTGAKLSIRNGIGHCTTYGDCGFKVHRNGISEILPVYVFKVVDKSDYNKILGTCLVDVIKDKDKQTGFLTITHVRFEIHMDGKIFDIVYKAEPAYPKIKLIHSVDYTFTYGNTQRVIPKGGKWYDTGIEDCSLLQIASINRNKDGAYGCSLYVDIQDNVYGLEQRLTIANSTLNNLTQPIMCVGASTLETDEATGEHRLKTINGKYLVFNDLANAPIPKAFEQDFKLENSEKMVDIFLDLIYIMSELGKPFICGEYNGGNLSTESMNNLIKPAIDKSNRILTEIYYVIRDSIYCLARLNDINIKKEDLSILFNIGRTDDDSKICDIVTKLVPNKQVVSAKYVLEKYFGMDSDQADEIFKQIELENNLVKKDSVDVSQQDIKNNDLVDKNIIKDNENQDIKNKNQDKELEEDKQNETK